MNKQEQESKFDTFSFKMKEVLLSKGDDYADTDRLSNFKKVAAMCNLKPEQVVLVLVATKVARLGALLSSQNDPKHESISDSVLDLANYSALMEMVLNEDIEPFEFG